MKVLALVNLRLKSVDGVIDLRVGETVTLPEDKVNTLLMKIPDKIRLIQPGFIVRWKSPLFGVCEGRVSEVVSDVVVIDEHGVTKEQTKIPAGWITKIEEAVG